MTFKLSTDYLLGSYLPSHLSSLIKQEKTELAKAGTLVLGLTIAQIILGISTLLLSVQIHTAITHQFIAIILLLSVVRLTYLSSEKSQLGA